MRFELECQQSTELSSEVAVVYERTNLEICRIQLEFIILTGSYSSENRELLLAKKKKFDHHYYSDHDWPPGGASGLRYLATTGSISMEVRALARLDDAT